jgi:hypothetical protein
MVVSTENRARPLTGVQGEYDQNERTIPIDRTGINQQGQGSMVFYIFAALVLLVGGYYLYNYYVSPGAMSPTVTQTAPSTAPAAPKVDAPAQTPTIAPSTTPPAVSPVTPPVDQKIP